MIRLVELGNNSENTIQPEELKNRTLSNVWLELVDPTKDELQAVADATQVSNHFLKTSNTGGVVDIRMEEDYGIVNFLVMRDPTSSKESCPIVFAFSKNFLVTVATKEAQPIVDTAKERMSKTKIEPPSQVMYFVIDEIIAQHYNHLEKLEGLTSKIEEELVEKTKSDELKKIFRLKGNMIRFNKVLWYERGVVFDLRKCRDNCMPAKVCSLFDTTHEDLTRQIDIVETYREILSDGINVYLSAVSNKINLSIQGLTVVIFYLTIVTTVTSFPNTVATFFGISQFGNTHIAIVTVALLLSIVLPFVWLWRKKWLKYVNRE